MATCRRLKPHCAVHTRANTTPWIFFLRSLLHPVWLLECVLSVFYVQYYKAWNESKLLPPYLHKGCATLHAAEVLLEILEPTFLRLGLALDKKVDLICLILAILFDRSLTNWRITTKIPVGGINQSFLFELAIAEYFQIFLCVLIDSTFFWLLILPDNCYLVII